MFALLSQVGAIAHVYSWALSAPHRKRPQSAFHYWRDAHLYRGSFAEVFWTGWPLPVCPCLVYFTSTGYGHHRFRRQ